MSAQFKLAKQKVSQHDLRKLMNDQKSKSITTKIDSPLAKYNDLGQLTCVLCKSVVRSEDVWKVHVNAKQHKQNVEMAKKFKEQTQNFTIATTMKRPATPPPSTSSSSLMLGMQSDQPAPKKLKGILKNSKTTQSIDQPAMPSNTIPSDFFDAKPSISTSSFYEATLQKTSIRKDLVNFKSRDKNGANMFEHSTDIDMDNNERLNDDETLPEGFFDDPVKDAKARNLEYKDPIEEEWERFQKEIKTASNFSNAIMAEDQAESTTERQIDEIDEQIRNWSRVLRLEKKKEEIIDKEKQNHINAEPNDDEMNGKNNDDDLDDDKSDDDNDDDFDEFLDWRSKKSHK